MFGKKNKIDSSELTDIIENAIERESTDGYSEGSEERLFLANPYIIPNLAENVQNNPKYQEGVERAIELGGFLHGLVSLGFDYDFAQALIMQKLGTAAEKDLTELSLKIQRDIIKEQKLISKENSL